MPRAPRQPTSFVTEWFGHLVWPPEEVDDSEAAVRDQREQRCPFLSNATQREVPCFKKARTDGLDYRTGFCTASSLSSGQREDWLACPARVFDEPFTLIRDAIVHLFRLETDAPMSVLPITRFDQPEVRRLVERRAEGAADRVFAFASNPPTLGGEIDIPESPGSPGNKVDVTIFEIVGIQEDGDLALGQFAIFEIQTADFHGSPLHAVAELRALGPPAAEADYHEAIAANPELLGRRVEGPNKANIFKRTIYQMILKIQMAKDPRCAGFCVVLPEPVWRSWGRHLGNPQLTGDGATQRLEIPGTVPIEGVVEPEPAWIIVFKIDRESALTEAVEDRQPDRD